MYSAEQEAGEDLERKLTHLYVALAMTRNLAQRACSGDETDKASRSVMTLVDVASGILEEILNPPTSFHSDITLGPLDLEQVM